MTKIAKRLCIKLSTAKLIMKKYKTTGKYFVKNMGLRASTIKKRKGLGRRIKRIIIENKYQTIIRTKIEDKIIETSIK
jgi:hypothetical protein